MSRPGVPAIREIRDAELALAAVDHECQQQHYRDVYDEVAHDLEAEFVEQHRNELESYRDYLAVNEEVR